MIRPEAREIRYLTVGISPGGIREVYPTHESVRVDRSIIERVTLVHGFTSERPIASLIVSIALMLGALTAMGLFSGASGSLPRFSARMLAAAGMLGALGVWLLVKTFSRGTYLLVEGGGEARKCVFVGRVEREKLDAFVAQARREFGYVIDQRE